MAYNFKQRSIIDLCIMEKIAKFCCNALYRKLKKKLLLPFFCVGCNIDVGNSTVVPEACVTDGESLLAFFRYDAVSQKFFLETYKQ